MAPTAITALSDIVVYLRELLPANAPTGILKHALFNAARRLCEDSEAWEVELTAVNLVAGTDEYAISAPSGGEIYRILNVYWRTATDVTNGDAGGAQDPGTYTFHRDTSKIEFNAAPATSVTSGLLVKAVIVPIVGSIPGEPPTWLLNRYQRAIAYAAASELCGVPRRLYSNERLSIQYERRYRGLSGKAVREASAQYKPGMVRGGNGCAFIGS